MKKLNTRFVKFASLMSMSFLLTACGSVGDGNFAAVKNFWDKAYQDELIDSGREWNFLDSVYEILGKEVLLEIPDAKPKDIDGVMLEELDVTLTVKTIKSPKIISFLRDKSDISYSKEHDAYLIGHKYIIKDAGSVLGRTIKKYKSEDLLNDKEKVEDAFKKELQTELDKFYGEIFKIGDVKFARIQVSNSIEAKIQATSAIAAEEAKNSASLKILEGRKNLEQKAMSDLADVSKNTGISVENILHARMINAMNDNPNSANVTITQSAPKK